jgi:hypothetical protein
MRVFHVLRDASSGELPERVGSEHSEPFSAVLERYGV